MIGLNPPIPRLFALVVASAAILGPAADAGAGLVIDATFVGGDPPPNIAGGGNLTQIFNTAISYWEAAFQSPTDNWVVKLNYQWGALSSALNAQFYLGTQGGDPHRIETGSITFNNTGSTSYFADPNPTGNSAYGHYQEVTMQEPGGTLNVGRIYTDPTGDAVGRVDLLTIAEHEIGHALGLSLDNTASSSQIDVTAPRPFAGLTIYTYSGDHLFQSTALMGGLFANPDERVLISGLDVLTEAQISRFATPNLDPYSVPEPGSLGLTLAGLIAVAAHATASRRSRRVAMRA
jgi:hypothetical protein